MPFVYSTATCGSTYVVYAPKNDPKSLSHIIKRIEINGGHGMKNPKGIETPRGVVTKVTDEELEILKNNSAFKRHVAAGFITYDDKQVDPARMAENMADKDASAPLTPKDFEESETSTDETPVYKNKKKR